MDPFSHAIVGGTAAALSCRKSHALKSAIICGALAGMSPDMDVLIRSASDPMFGLKFHRYITHALIAAPVIALVMAWLLRWIFRQQSFKTLYLFCIIGVAMHGVLDAMTNYGTHLFWPFTPRRESWSIISIIDPIFTFTLLGLLIATYRTKKRQYAAIGAAFALCYWGLGYYQREQATTNMMQLAESRGHTVERYEVKPSFANLVVWRMQYLYDGNIYIDAVHMSPWAGHVIYEGGSLPLYTPSADMSPVQLKDFEYFKFFSDGWLAYAPKHNDLISDVRFSMLPNQLDPIWGIRLHPETLEAHVSFENVRSRSEGDVQVLWQMIQGKALMDK